MASHDRVYLAQIMAATIGVTAPEAEKRADAAITNVKAAIARSRRNTVIVAFFRQAGAGAKLSI